MRGTDLNKRRKDIEDEIEMLENDAPEGEELPESYQRDLDALREELAQVEDAMARKERRAREREFRSMVL